MCTLIAVHRHVPGRPLLVAANRDEFLDRPAEGLAIRETRAGRVMAPLDVRAGGTWLGLSARGVFAALTNLRGDPPETGRRSRGEIVIDALAAESAEAAVERLANLAKLVGSEAEQAYNPFNLFVADEDTAWVVAYRSEAIVQRLDPGVHVIGNVDATGPPNAKLRRIQAEAEAAVGELGPLEPREKSREKTRERVLERTQERVQRVQGRAQTEGVLERLAELCKHHEHASDPLSDTCVHVKGTHGRVTYGTRSSMLLELETGFQAGRLLQADGPPCEKKYEDLSTLLHDLGRQPVGVGANAQVRTAV